VTMGVDVVFPFSPHGELVAADRRGMPLAVDRKAVHAYGGQNRQSRRTIANAASSLDPTEA